MDMERNGAVDRAKKEAKRLLALGRKAHGHLPIGTLSEAQAIIANLKNCSSWHELEERAKRAARDLDRKEAQPNDIPSIEPGGGQDREAEKPGQLAQICRGLACEQGSGEPIGLPLLGSDARFLTSVGWLEQPSPDGASGLLAASMRQAKADADARQFFVVSSTRALEAGFAEMGGVGEFAWIKADAAGRFPAINPLETYPGERHLRIGARSAVVDFLVELCGMGDAMGVVGALVGAVGLAFFKRADAAQPFLYEKGRVPDIDRELVELGAAEPNLTWWQASDLLREKGRDGLSRMAQAMAVPTLGDIARELPAQSAAYGRVVCGNGRSVIEELVGRFECLEKSAAEYFARSQWWPSKNLRGLGFEISMPTMRAGESSARYLWARVVAKSCLPAYCGLRQGEKWQDVDVGLGEGAAWRGREAAKGFKAVKKTSFVAIVEGVERLSLSKAANKCMREDVEAARIRGGAFCAVGASAPEWASLASLRVKVESVEGPLWRLSYEASMSEGRCSGHCLYRMGPWDRWLASPRDADARLGMAAKACRDSERAIALVENAYPSGSWEAEAEEAAGDLPWEALLESERDGLARDRIESLLRAAS